MKRFVTLVLGLFFLLPCMNAQAIEVTPTTDLASLTDVFLQSANYSNVAYSGASEAIGTYTNNSSLWGIGGGMILSTGRVGDYSDGENTSTSWGTNLGTSGSSRVEDYLSALGSPGNSYDAVSFSFLYTPIANTISFDFIFGSDEYPEYVGSQYNDIFGVWVTNAAGSSQQIVFDQYGNPVTINSAWMSARAGTELDGVSQLLNTTMGVTPNEQYSFEFIIADVGDHIYDSTVFLANFREYDGQGGNDPVTDIVATPEPSTVFLLGIGLVGLFGIGRRKYKK